MRLDRSYLRGAVFTASFLLPLSANATATESLTNPLVPALPCQNCHAYVNAIPDAADPPYSPFVGWQGSMMANAARDPVFWAGVAVANIDDPGGTVDCIRCHSPRAFLEGRGDATTIDDLAPDDFGGVECELCHRMVDDPDEVPGNARYTLDDVPVGGEVPRRGPWDFTDGVPEPPHEWINDPYTGTSELCGTCHDVTTPRERVDDAGVGLGVSFNEQRTYSEWLGSDFALPGDDFQSCQDCHMPAVADMPGCTNNVDQFSHATGGRRHDLAGANRFMLELLKEEYGTNGTNEVNDFFYDTSIERMDELLATAATMDVTPPADVDVGEGLTGLDVIITNNSGHKLPSGYSEGRVMWIEVIGAYNGDAIFSSGAWDQTTGMQQDELLRTYEAIAEDFDSNETFHLLLNNHWVEDTRIPPLGLQPSLETDPVGDRYTQLGDNSWPNFDEYTYDFPGDNTVADATPGDTTDDELTVTIRLLYLINTPEYMEFLGDEGAAAGVEVAGLFDAMGGATPLVLAQEELTIPISGFGDPGGSSSTGVGEATMTTSVDDSTSGASMTMTGTPTTTPTTDPDSTGDESSGGTGQDDDGGGCGCQSDRRPSPGLLLMLPLLFGLRRRSASTPR